MPVWALQPSCEVTLAVPAPKPLGAGAMATGSINVRLRALVAEYGLTEELLADEVNERAHTLFGKYGNATARLVRYWLSGRIPWPNPYYLLPLEGHFGRPALELW